MRIGGKNSVLPATMLVTDARTALAAQHYEEGSSKWL